MLTRNVLGESPDSRSDTHVLVVPGIALLMVRNF